MSCKVLNELEKNFIDVRNQLTKIAMGLQSIATKEQLEATEMHLRGKIIHHKTEHSGCQEF